LVFRLENIKENRYISHREDIIESTFIKLYEGKFRNNGIDMDQILIEHDDNLEENNYGNSFVWYGTNHTPANSDHNQNNILVVYLRESTNNDLIYEKIVVIAFAYASKKKRNYHNNIQ